MMIMNIDHGHEDVVVVLEEHQDQPEVEELGEVEAEVVEVAQKEEAVGSKTRLKPHK
jgi:hypothetical protein